jgi:predicted transcriptional regulator
MTTLKVGIASYDQMKARTLAIAHGTRRVRRDDPKIWFTSMESFAKVLSDRNRSLLVLIAENQPDSLTELSELSGRAKSNLSRTLKTMERYGLVQLRKGHGGTIIPRVSYSGIDLAVPLTL